MELWAALFGWKAQGESILMLRKNKIDESLLTASSRVI